MSLEAIHEADAKESSSGSLPDFDEETMDLPVMIENYAKYGNITGSREPSREPAKKIKEEKLTEDPGQNEGPWAAQQPGQISNRFSLSTQKNGSPDRCSLAVRRARHQERMQEAKEKLDEAKKMAEKLEKIEQFAQQQQASSSSAENPSAGRNAISLKPRRADAPPRRSSSTGREIAKSRGATRSGC